MVGRLPGQAGADVEADHVDVGAAMRLGLRGELIGIALLPDGSELVSGSTDGNIHFWDFPAAMKRIADLKGSLTQHEK